MTRLLLDQSADAHQEDNFGKYAQMYQFKAQSNLLDLPSMSCGQGFL